VHRDVGFVGCSDTEKEYLMGFDGEEIFHADFIRKDGVMTLPDFADPISNPGGYENGVANIEVCKQNLDVDIKVYKPSVEQLGKTDTLHIIIIFLDDDIIALQ